MELGMTNDTDLDDIDLGQLEVELAQHSRLWKAASNELREAKRRKRKAASRQKVVEAEIRLKIIRHPKEFGIVKGTEKEVDAVLTTHEKVVGAIEKLHEAEYEIDIYQAQVTAREERRRNLEDLVKLHGQDYFAVPRMSGSPEIKEKVEATRSRAAARSINDALNRKRVKRD